MDNSAILNGQVALVTGGGRGIGRAIAQALAAVGARVSITARSQDQLDETVSLIQQARGQALALAGDVTHSDDVERVVTQTEQQFGPVDILVNNAGGSSGFNTFLESDIDAWWRDIELNLHGTVLYTHRVLKSMVDRRHGRIINVASRAGTIAMPNSSAYSASKAADIRFTEILALEMRPYGIGAFAIHPGGVRTMDIEKMRAELPERVYQAFNARLNDPPELAANLVVVLATGQADILSGRYISANDDIHALIARAEEKRAANLYALQVPTAAAYNLQTTYRPEELARLRGIGG